jgi:hypothetical protein
MAAQDRRAGSTLSTASWARHRERCWRATSGTASKKMRRQARTGIIRLTMKFGDFFASLRGRGRSSDGDEPARFSAPAARTAKPANVHPYHAVSVKPGLMCCQQARKLRNKRFLSRSAPSIPLPGCTLGKECACGFQKHNDRRQGDRRLFGCEPDSRYFSGVERRGGGRRSTDPRTHA